MSSTPSTSGDSTRWTQNGAGDATYGSWPNWIESEFAALRYFARGGTDHRTHEEQNAAIAAYVRWRNARAEPKTNFAQDSPIRQWTQYPAKAAGHAVTRRAGAH